MRALPIVGALAGAALLLTPMLIAQPGVNAPGIGQSDDDRRAPQPAPADRGSDASRGARASDIDGPPTSAERFEIRGRVTSASHESLRVERSDGHSVTLSLDESTQLRGAQDAVQPGAEVRATFTREGDAARAEQIEVLGEPDVNR